MRVLRRPSAPKPRSRWRLIRRVATIGVFGGFAAYRRQRLDAADREFPEAVTRNP